MITIFRLIQKLLYKNGVDDTGYIDCTKIFAQVKYTFTKNYIYGFKDLLGTYYICVDKRFFGMKVQDIMIICKTKKIYELYLTLCKNNSVEKAIFNDNRIVAEQGNKIKVKFNFDCPPNEKEISIYLSSDIYAYENTCPYKVERS